MPPGRRGLDGDQIVDDRVAGLLVDRSDDVLAHDVAVLGHRFADLFHDVDGRLVLFAHSCSWGSRPPGDAHGEPIAKDGGWQAGTAA